MHNMPGIPTGRFAIRSGAMLASSDSWQVTLQRQPAATGAMPDRGTDPTYVAAQFMVAMQGIIGRNVPPSQAAGVERRPYCGGAARASPKRHPVGRADQRHPRAAFLQPWRAAARSAAWRSWRRALCRAGGCAAESKYYRRYPPR